MTTTRDAVTTAIREQGGLATSTLLRAEGHGRRAIAHAVGESRLIRIWDSWLAVPDAPRTGVTAILHRGKLTGSTALESYGVWNAVDRRIHIQRPRHGHGGVREPRVPLSSFPDDGFPRGEVVQHWRPEIAPFLAQPWRVSVTDALLTVARTASGEQFIACVENALATGALSWAAVPVVFSRLPARMRSLRAAIRRDAESGLETLARLRLSRWVRDVRSQVWIDGVGPGGRRGRVDLLLDGWLVIELDGDRHHDPATDRLRDSVLVRQGFRCHRFGYDQVIHHWDEVAATVRELLRAAPGAVRPGHGRAGPPG